MTPGGGAAEGSPKKARPGASLRTRPRRCIAPVPAVAEVAARSARPEARHYRASIRPTGWGLHHSRAHAQGRTADYPGRTSGLGDQLHSMQPPPPGCPGHPNLGPHPPGPGATPPWQTRASWREPRCGVFSVEGSGLGKRSRRDWADPTVEYRALRCSSAG